MPPTITIKGKRPRKGRRMTKDTRYRIAAVTGRQRVFIGTLIGTVNHGRTRLAIFSVPKKAS